MSAARTAVQQSGVAPTTYIDVLQLKSWINIAATAREYGVELRKSGSDEYVALCPFHDERTPSFTVNESKGLWHCFSCDLGGDVISLVMKLENRPFREIVTLLAERHGLNRLVQQTRLRVVPRFSRTQLAEAGLFLTGFVWILERQLVDRKEIWLVDESAPECAGITTVTALLDSVQQLTPHEVAQFLGSYRKIAPKLCDECIAEAGEFAQTFARVFTAAISPGYRA